jgi:aryl-alcohol dehydrogenase-like predicted oxidoreductase
MEYRVLGRTGWSVSAISLGTVSLGVDYGIAAPGDSGRPADAAAVRLLRRAAETGINLFDTAPNYGESERLIGEALAGLSQCFVATKVSIPRGEDEQRLHGAAVRQAVERSLARSRVALRRNTLDLVQIHNATEEVIAEGAITETLLTAQRRGELRAVGASVYGAPDAMAAITSGCFDTLQVAYNVLDQRMATRVFEAARAAGVGLIVRSAFLKGALSAKARWLPDELEPLRRAASQATATLAAGSWTDLPAVALRFCLSSPHVASTLVGARTEAELAQSLAAAELGPLPAEALEAAYGLALTDERLLNPTYWPIG